MNIEGVSVIEIVGWFLAVSGLIISAVKNARDRRGQAKQFAEQLEYEKGRFAEEIEVEKEKLRAEAKKSFIDDAEQVLGLYKNSFDECGRRIDALEQESVAKDLRIAELEARLNLEVATKKAVIRENADLKIRVAELERLVRELQDIKGKQ